MASPEHTGRPLIQSTLGHVGEILPQNKREKQMKKKIMPAFQRFHVISSGIVSSVSALDTEDHALKEKKYEQ